MEMLIIDNVKYYACTDIAKKLNLKNGMEVVNKYSNDVVKKYNKWWIKASLFKVKSKEAKFSFRGITPISINNMNKAVLVKDSEGRISAGMSHTEEYKKFRKDMRGKIKEAFEKDKNILKDISLAKPLILDITAYCVPKIVNGNIYVKDCSNVTKPLEDILYQTISKMAKLYSFDDKINIKVITSIVDVKNKNQEGYDVIIKNAKGYSERTEELRCGNIRREIALR